ncbi:response regulator transcription factor [Vineibacter terrae]|uniref:response regulator transcription factor n=1 Tax=Vineibacter terrae TaxID=2586908 RepID=UPI002E327E87|nr:response regulator transcription factor [Vineibacter terrae]HEX2885667.1 response regulator transcription factor [Vineibacter terrae]
MAQRLSTALIGPNALFREGLRGVLHSTHYQLKGVSEAIETVQKAIDLDLIILIAGADETIVLEQVQRAKQESPNARVVVVSDNDRLEMIQQLRNAGADGCILGTVSSEALLASLDVVMLGGAVVPPMPRIESPLESRQLASIDQATVFKVQDPVTDSSCKRLSNRETDILLCLMKGESNKIIARRYDIAEATVKVHLKAILRKIRVRNRTQAAVWAHNNQQALPARPPNDGRVGPAGVDGGRISLDAVWQGKAQLAS